LLDIFPTLLELAGFPARADLEGHSLVPLLANAEAPREWPAITTHNHDNHGIRTERWRYIRYADGSEELYDVQADPHEWKNVASDPQLAETKRELAKWIPRVNRQPVPGSQHRILIYDPATGDANWEGQPIGKNDPIPD
jgi:arylsulfatase A-like enzyme